MDHLCISHSVLSATDRLLHPLLTASNASFCSNRFPHQRGGFPEFGNLSSASAPPPQGADPILLPLLLFSLLFSILPSYAGIFIPGVQGVLFTWCPRSSSSFHLVFCENCCICRCIPDTSMERDELHVHLHLSHLECPWISF